MSRRLSLPDAALACVLPKELLRILDAVCRFYHRRRSEIVTDVMRVFLIERPADQCYRFAPVSQDTAGTAREKRAIPAKSSKAPQAPVSGGRRRRKTNKRRGLPGMR